jgi:hypothetical protein
MADNSPWQPIDTAPKYGPKGRYDGPVRIDILAKIWLRDEDKFQFIRCTDCYWDDGDAMCNRRADWKGVEPGYRAVAWMPIPVIPKEWP